jgi:hypothetical protein
MASIRKRRRAQGTVWIVDYRDAAGFTPLGHLRHERAGRTN